MTNFTLFRLIIATSILGFGFCVNLTADDNGLRTFSILNFDFIRMPDGYKFMIESFGFVYIKWIDR